MAEPLTHKFRIGDMVRITHRPKLGGSYRVLSARVNIWRPCRIEYFLRGVLGPVPEDQLEAAEGKE